MKDNYARSITYLRVSVTDLCNLRCRYCMPECGVDKREHGDILRFEEIQEIVAAAAELGVRKVRITGGEPLVRPGLPELCRKLSGIPGVEELDLTTNGLLLERDAQALKEAGVCRVNISLDTLKPDRFSEMTRGDDLNQVLRGIEAARRVGLTPIKLNTVLIGGFNDDEISDLVELTRKQDLEVRFIELMPMGVCAGWDRRAFLPVETVRQRCPDLEPTGAEGVASCYRLPGASGTVGLIAPMSHVFCGDCSRIRITADGKLKPCLHSGEEIPLRGLTGEDLIQAVRQGIARKPERHHLERRGGSETRRSMNEIGG